MELEHLPSTTLAPERAKPCERCDKRPRVVVTWGEHSVDTGLCAECGAEESARIEGVHEDHRADRRRQFDRDLGKRYAGYTFDTFPVSDRTLADALRRVQD